MRALLAAAVLAVAALAPAVAQTPAPAPVERCRIGVRAVIPVDAGAAAPAATYIALLQSGAGERRVSGTLWVNASGAAYHVPFSARRVAAAIEASDAIAFRLPRGVSIDDAFVDALDDGGPHACAIDGVWTPALPVLAVGRQLGGVTPVDAQPIASPEGACRAPDVPGQVVATIAPTVPPDAEKAGIGGAVTVFVKLAADSTIQTAVIGRSPNPMFDAPSLDVARHTIFATAVKRCRPVGGTSAFVVQFEVAPRATPRP